MYKNKKVLKINLYVYHNILLKTVLIVLFLVKNFKDINHLIDLIK